MYIFVYAMTRGKRQVYRGVGEIRIGVGDKPHDGAGARAAFSKP